MTALVLSSSSGVEEEGEWQLEEEELFHVILEDFRLQPGGCSSVVACALSSVLRINPQHQEKEKWTSGNISR